MGPRYLIPSFVLLVLPLPASEQKPLFDAAVVVAPPNARIVKTLDLDGDGWVDAIGWWQSTVSQGQYATAKIFGWINDHTGKLVQCPWNPTFSFNIYETLDPRDLLETGDLNGDGQEDFVIGSRHEIRVYVSHGAAEPTLFAVKALNENDGIALADFDLDGDLDLAVNNSSTLQIHRMNWTGGVLELIDDFNAAYGGKGRLVAAQLVGGPAPDLVYGGSRIFPVENATIQAPLVFPGLIDVESDYRHDVGDIDGDGDLDVVSFRVRTGMTPEYRVLRHTGPDTFVAEDARPGGPARILFDLDGDGDLDGTCCGGGGINDPPMNTAPSKFRMSWNDGTGNFAPSVSMPGLGSTAIAGIADLDHDGDFDYVAGRCVYYANGPIRENPFVACGTRVQSERTLVDYDGDGDPDVELSLQGVKVNLGDGTSVARTHSLPAPPAGSGRTGTSMPGDWDGDGVVDLIAVLGTEINPTGLELLRNVGGGTFESKGLVAGPAGLLANTPNGTGRFPNDLDDSLAVDMDGDGDLDLVRRTRSDTLSDPVRGLWSSWFRNDGSLGFTHAGDFPGKLVLAVDDLNGDAYPDLLAVEYVYSSSGDDSDPLQWAAGLGSGTFNRWAEIQGTAIGSLPPRIDQVVIADIDSDGDRDILHPCEWANNKYEPRLHLNDGFGHFAQDAAIASSTLELGGVPGAVVAADLNGDGLLDLVFGPIRGAGSAAAIYLRKADGTGWEDPFWQVLFDTVGTPPVWNPALSARDPDGDGDIDLITSSMIRNRTLEGTEAGERRQVQSGVAGIGGIVPTLGACGPFRVGMTAELRLRGARPAATGELRIQDLGTAPSTFAGTPGRHLARFVRHIEISTSGYAYDPPGSGAWSNDFSVPSTFVGRTYRYEVLVADPGAPGGYARSNALLLTFGL